MTVTVRYFGCALTEVFQATRAYATFHFLLGTYLVCVDIWYVLSLDQASGNGDGGGGESMPVSYEANMEDNSMMHATSTPWLHIWVLRRVFPAKQTSGN